MSHQITKGKQLLENRPINSDQYSAWGTVTRDFLSKVFESLSPNVSSVTDVGKYGSFPMNAGEEFWENHRAKSLSKQLTIMEGLMKVLQTEIALDQGTATNGLPVQPAIPLYLTTQARMLFCRAAAYFSKTIHSGRAKGARRWMVGVSPQNNRIPAAT